MPGEAPGTVNNLWNSYDFAGIHFVAVSVKLIGGDKPTLMLNCPFLFFFRLNMIILQALCNTTGKHACRVLIYGGYR